MTRRLGEVADDRADRELREPLGELLEPPLRYRKQFYTVRVWGRPRPER
jgi:hypothetical protein